MNKLNIILLTKLLFYAQSTRTPENITYRSGDSNYTGLMYDHRIMQHNHVLVMIKYKFSMFRLTKPNPAVAKLVRFVESISPVAAISSMVSTPQLPLVRHSENNFLTAEYSLTRRPLEG